MELRSTISLSRLLQEQPKRGAARQLLIGSYGRFSEGFGMAGLEDGQALLGEFL